jgi:hypothetical protein
VRRAALAVLVGFPVILFAASGYGADATDTATAALTVDNVVSLSFTWDDTGTDHIDLGTVPNDSHATGWFTADVTHNMDPSQTFDVSFVVEKTLGPAWENYVSIDNVLETLYWDETDFGASKDFVFPVGGTSQTFQVTAAFYAWVSATQASASYQFDITMTVTSL